MDEKKVMMDDRIESYKSFFDHEWARAIHTETQGTPLVNIVRDLCMSWKSAANTHHMPALTVILFKSFADALLNAHESLPEKYIKVISDQLTKRMGKALSHSRQLEMSKILKELRNGVEQSMLKEKIEVDAQAFWKEALVESSEFRLILLGSQRMVYGAIYYAYEDFLVRVYSTVVGDADYRMWREKQFSDDLAVAFDDGLRDYCWMDQSVRIARLTRNALVHNGGRMKGDLATLSHGLIVQDGEIQILPEDSTALYRLLKDRASRLVTEAIKKLQPSFNLTP